MKIRPLVVADVNVLVSGTTISATPPSQVMQLWLENLIDLVTSEPILLDLERVLAYPKVVKYTHMTDQEQQLYLKELRGGAKVVAGTLSVNVSADQDDDKIFSCAVDAKADYIVSGDERHVLPIGTFQGIPVVRPREFLSIFEELKKAA
jgi:hypothetical protein